MTDPVLTRTEGEGETLDLPEGVGSFKSGQILGDRYQIRSLLGRGGMGEVWHAFDLKLRVEVALKALREDLFKSDRRREALREEVRTAREVMSPNVCRVFDLQEVDGRELVSMEYVDGQTLLEVLHNRGPLELKEAQDVASQFLSGLEAIHKVGLVHRDIKPENIMLTRAGRVVVMDFGIARQEAEGGGTVSGTPAYMAPEQAAGETLDARADVYSAGVVLAEMVSPEGIRDFESRQSVWEGLRSEPAKVPDTPWAPVLEKAVSRDRDRRYRTAHTLTRALEDVTLRVEGSEDLHPYPGLASFTEDDVEYFFGREAEVEQMWRKLEGPPRMLALAGPSGAGKSSFLRAGLLATKHSDWGHLVCTPGGDPRASLRRAVIPELGGDPVALLELAESGDDATVSAFARWSDSHQHALLIIDQFEELFTQNSAGEQQRCAVLLGRLVLEANTFVLTSLRDDFLYRCHEQDSLQPALSDLTMIGPPKGGALRRALVQPAQKCGYRFEDDTLVDGMLAEVEGERGALPLLAFAAARLWELRDRESGQLTRQGYQDIGGVSGALAQHAESTIDRIGSERIPYVREVFRNLVTSDGTRAVREWDELLSIFDGVDRATAENVLRELIDARLLTSYEVREEGRRPNRRVEIIHESLLANWPRLVRWQTQDADGAQLRDQLRQAARTWDDQGRTDDTLWTGSAYREFAVWREHYSGGLSETEDAYAKAMTALAGRRRRRRRLIAASVLMGAALVTVVTTTLWRRSVFETRRAEATKMLTLAQLEHSDYPTALLAFAARSLELADTVEGRLLALEALWRGPPARILAIDPGVERRGGFYQHALSPDGQWLVSTSTTGLAMLVPSDGGPVRTFRHPAVSGPRMVFFPPDSSAFAADFKDGLWVRSVPTGETIYREPLERNIGILGRGDRILRFDLVGPPEQRSIEMNSRPFSGGSPTDTMSVDVSNVRFLGSITLDVDPEIRWLAIARDGEAYIRPLESSESSEETRIGDPERIVDRVSFGMSGDQLVIVYQSGEAQVWPVPGEGGPVIELPSIGESLTSKEWFFLPFVAPQVDVSGALLARGRTAGSLVFIRDLRGPPGFDDVALRRTDAKSLWDWRFDQKGPWLTVLYETSMAFWPLDTPRVRVLSNAFEADSGSLKTTADGAWIVSCAMNEGLRFLPTRPGVGEEHQVGDFCWSVAVHPELNLYASGSLGGPMYLGSIGEKNETTVIEKMGGFPYGASFDRDGRRLVVGTGYSAEPEDMLLRVVDLETGNVREIDQLAGLEIDPEQWTGLTRGIGRTEFSPDGTLYSAGFGGLRRWDLQASACEFLVNANFSRFDLSPDGAHLLVLSGNLFDSQLTHSEIRVLNVDTGSSRFISSHGSTVTQVAFDQSGTVIVTGDVEGIVRVGPIDGSEPHQLLGHTGEISGVVVSPDGKWLYTAGGTEIRQWPMPDITTPPLHTLPREELIAKLKSFTNLRVVRDEKVATGWKLEVGPFPGWEEVPEW